MKERKKKSKKDSLKYTLFYKGRPNTLFRLKKTIYFYVALFSTSNGKKLKFKFIIIIIIFLNLVPNSCWRTGGIQKQKNKLYKIEQNLLMLICFFDRRTFTQMH